ncbi:hypothetical protein UFOVP26_84 [uncultured Caudovirales phage]|uniref:Uncharacterized protein n=1 Tax=uncultured Caudovirales phage TaxID=2100421 RepID=A0A6J5KL12_9CAUD|nr:hypothetical protein UFOVP26_84 [uncultured Caudovirales phage]CAB4123594.1 hypothetical protein UFOVP44_13 [uncultured Caudovirales phage]CAB5218839.1 hypothetical protein UFOVP220_4 [uncultured Caudovirales phage]
MNLLPIAQVIEEAGIAKAGTDLFLNLFPAEVETGILLRSPLTGTKIDYELPEYRKASFQAVIRTHAQKYAIGDTMARAVFGVLTFEDIQLDTIYVKYIRPRHEPVSFRGSPGNNVEFSINFDICFVVTDTDGY